ncbi:MAG: sensor histidine kinase [Clostridium sp.]|uniref:sensor histidine kinase n=1 Tax=Clostridium sp. TaxID=1506 RepID=UPI003EE7A2A5
MSIGRYFKDRSLFLGINLFLYFLVVLLLSLVSVGSGILFLIFIIWFLPIISYMIIEYFKVGKFYKDIKETVEELEEKYLVCEIVNKPNFIEGEIIYEGLKECNKEMHERVKAYRKKTEEYKEYIDMWVHEIKTPIAATKLIIDNSDSREVKRIDNELKKIDKMIEQVLYYSKIDEANEDYRIVNLKLQEVVGKVLKNNSMDFILKRIRVDLKNLDLNIFCDKKWLEFILNQIIGNSLKYTKNEGEILLEGIEKENSVELLIKDNGVGIRKEDLKKVFLKGYTGKNGRIFGKSTGMGLYICKKLCDKLNIGIKISSEENGTSVKLIFSKGKNTNLFK